MADLNSTDYYQSRERRERQLAEAAKNPAISAIHLEMATRYSELVSSELVSSSARQTQVRR